MDDLIECEGFGIGMTANEDDVLAFFAFGETKDQMTHYVTFPLAEFKQIMIGLMTIGNEMGKVDGELADLAGEQRVMRLKDIHNRYNAGQN